MKWGLPAKSPTASRSWKPAASSKSSGLRCFSLTRRSSVPARFSARLSPTEKRMANKFVLVLHGGAGVISKAEASVEQQFRDGMRVALEAGRAVLKAGGAVVDAVVAIQQPVSGL